jgi:hypothetical protein
VSSEKQNQANRFNGHKGGVKTAEGKAVVRLNAVTHGFFSKSVLVPGENSRKMDEFRESFMSELRPEGELETILVDRIVSSSWRLNRLLKTERNNPDMIDYHSCWQNYIRYEATLERQIYKALHEFFLIRAVRLEEKAKAKRDQAIFEISSLQEESNSRKFGSK